ncbi:MAG: sugar phosphate isomerase/epimerase [Lachnospiraceae bacterium]|nr:sugar phosphate isomerase/epimerase [Lachnospiraceae bacterium]
MAEYKFKAGTFFHHIREASKELGESLEDTITRVLGMGYVAAELDADDLDGTESLSKKGMLVSSIYRNYGWRNGIDRAVMEDHIRLAKRFGAGKIMAIPGLYSDKSFDPGELERMKDGMLILSDLARENGLILTIEDYDNALSPIATMGGMKIFLDADPELRVALDTGNFLFSGEDILDAEKLFLTKVAHVHLKDRLYSKAGEGDVLVSTDGRKLYPCAVGDGDIPINEVLQKLTETGYDGYVLTEFFGSHSYFCHIERSAENLKKEGWI